MFRIYKELVKGHSFLQTLPIRQRMRISARGVLGILDRCLKPIRGAANAAASSIQDMSVNHVRAHILVPQKILHGSDIIAILKQVSRKGVAIMPSSA